MTKMGWFLAGFLVSQLLTLITGTTPQQAMKNLRAWLQIVRLK